jgi:uncharacterized repeat protein (TIGR01451 family)
LKGGWLVRAWAAALVALAPAFALAVHNASAVTQWNGNGSVGPDGTTGCAYCHGSNTPPAAQLSGAGTTTTVLNHVITQMGCDYATSLSATNRLLIAQWLLERVNGQDHNTSLLFTASNTTTGFNSGRTISASTHINTGTYAFDRIETVTINNGATLTWSGETGTFTPASNFVGDVTFTYRGRDNRVVPNVLGHTHTGVIRVGTTPTTTGNTSHSGTYNSPITTYQLGASPNATGTTYAITSGALPSGLSLTTSGVNAGQVTGTPMAVGTFNVTFTASNNLGAGTGLAVQFIIGRATPTVSFNAQASVDYAFGSSFNVTAATVSPAQAVADGVVPRYTAQAPSQGTVCDRTASTSTSVGILSAGNCVIRANTALTTNWNAAANVDDTIVINKINQTVSFAGGQGPVTWSNGGSIAISPTATTSAVGQADISIAYTSGNGTVCSVSAPNFTTLRAGTCPVVATANSNANYNQGQATQNITINSANPSAPAIGVATPADTQASIAFTPLTTANDGGASILQYTATCNPGGFTAQNTTSPILVTGLTNGQLYSCSVTATQVAPHSKTSAASATVNVTPAVYPAITSANNTTFTVLVPGTFSVTATGSPAPTLLLSGTLPSGVTFDGPGLSPRTLSGTPASGTVGTYNLVFTADGSDPDATQNFTLTVAKRNQTVNFTDPADTTFGSGNVALVSAPTSGLGVSYVSLTPAVCGTSGSNATLLDVGTCTIEATAAGNADWNSATQQQSFSIAKGNQSITFNTQVTNSRPVAPNQTFLVDPVATASSGLAISYSTMDSGICTASGTTITMKNAGVCAIVASQPGDTKWNAATPVTQNVTLTQASQTITFPAQAAQNFSPGGTFSINPAATASSGLAISYVTNTSAICTITGSTVTIVTIGACSIRAEQGGDGNYTVATPVSATIQINAVVPPAPGVGNATPGNQHAKIEYTAPSHDGGTPITSYRATCAPGAITGTGTTSPITVTGLTNGQAYTCTVAAQNSVGFGSESASVGVMPNLQGNALWTANCQSCHGATPGGARFNAAGAGPATAVLDYVIATNPQMNIPSLNALNPLERLDLKQYITSFLMSSGFAGGETTATNTPKVINLGGHLSLNTMFPNPPGADLPGSFTSVAIDVMPTNGTLTPLGGIEFLYTPNPGFNGSDSFQYHGAGNATGDTFIFALTVDAAAPVLTVAKNGTGAGLVFSDTPTSGIDCGSDCTEAWNSNTQVSLIATASPGSTFIGWTGACAGSSVVCNVTMNASKGVTATFDLTPFDLTVARSGAGTGAITSAPAGISCGATCTAGFPPGTAVTLTPTPAAGSAFTAWSGACSGSGACVVTMDAAKSVTATFQPTFVLTVSRSGLGSGSVASTPAGINCGSTCNAEYVTGAVVSLTPTPAAGSAFTGWSGDCSGTGACSVAMTAIRNVTANFTPLHTLTVQKIGNGNGSVTSNPAGITACSGTCTADYLDTTVVSLTANIGADTEFLGWGGACSGTGACSVTMSAARSVTANFKSSIALTVTHAGSGSGVVASSPEGIGVSCGTGCTVGFDPGTVVTLGRSPAAGSVFAGWSGACTGTGACVLTMSQSRSVTATFNLTGGPQADLAVASHTSDPPAAASVGQPVTFSLAIANNGPAGATNVVLTDTLPTGATFVSASPGCTHNAGTVTCAIGALASGASVQVQVVIQPTAAGGATNFASVAAAEADPLSFNNASALAIQVSAAANLGRLSNISTRMQVLTGDDVMIGGFVIGGSAAKTVVVRARGPSLASLGVPGVLANPRLQLFAGQAQIASNDNWGDATNAATIAASGFAPADANEAAILMTLAPGAYTAIVSGVANATGVAIVEVFEVDAILVPLANISTRGRVQTGANVMIGGFVIQGDGPQTIVVRARGPSLAQFGIQGLLANPQLQLFAGATQIASNDNWQQAANAVEVQASGFAPSDPMEAAILITLQPGAYTAIVSGVAGGTGIAIVEVFRN